MPKNKQYFVDKDFGVFAIKPEHAFICNNASVYVYDVRNANPIDLGLHNELYKWANFQGLWKITRQDVRHAKELSGKSLEQLQDEQRKARKETRAFMTEVLAQIDSKNKAKKEKQEREGGDIEDSDEYKPISKESARFIIVRNLFERGYIDQAQAENLGHLLKLGQITTTDQLFSHLDDFTKVYVTQPLKLESQRILDDFHTYSPKDIIQLIQKGTSVNKGLKNLRTKPLINWFPATYLLFGALGVAVVMIIAGQYGYLDFMSGSITGTP